MKQHKNSINRGYGIGTENALMWPVLEPEMFEMLIKRVGEFLDDFLEGQIQEGQGRLSGIVLMGDVAYKNGMLFSPDTWRKNFKPITKRLIKICHKNNLMIIYHGCGDAQVIYEDFVEIGLDSYNPLEVKSGLDLVKIKKDYEGRLAFVGNIDVRILEGGIEKEMKREVLYKLQAAKGGGWVFQSDHSISSSVAPESYEYALAVLREYGNYPLDLEKIKKELED